MKGVVHREGLRSSATACAGDIVSAPPLSHWVCVTRRTVPDINPAHRYAPSVARIHPHSATNRRRRDRREPSASQFSRRLPGRQALHRTPRRRTRVSRIPVREPCANSEPGVSSAGPTATPSSHALARRDRQTIRAARRHPGDLLRRAIPRMTDEQFDRAVEVLDAFERARQGGPAVGSPIGTSTPRSTRRRT